MFLVSVPVYAVPQKPLRNVEMKGSVIGRFTLQKQINDSSSFRMKIYIYSEERRCLFVATEKI